MDSDIELFIKGKSNNKEVAEKVYKFAILALTTDKYIDSIDFARDILIRDGVYSKLNPLIKNEKSSCYINCILVALFLRPNRFITSKILLSGKHTLITNELKNITLSMRIFHGMINTSSKLREVLANNSNQFQNYMKGEFEDAYEFFSKIFDLYKVSINSYQYVHKNNDTPEIKKIDAIPTVIVNPEFFTKNKTLSVANFDYEIDQFTDDKKNRFTKINKFIDPKFLVINILPARTMGFTNNVIPSTKLKTYSNLNLSSIILYDDRLAHYTCVYIGDDDKWYEFNDMTDKPKELTDLDKDRIEKTSCIFFYQ